MAAHLYGTPGKIDEIKAVADKHGAKIIEDAAESLGASYKGKQTGTFGDFNAISFNGNKIITGSAGGMFLTDARKMPIKSENGLHRQERMHRGISTKKWDIITE